MIGVVIGKILIFNRFKNIVLITLFLLNTIIIYYLSLIYYDNNLINEKKEKSKKIIRKKINYIIKNFNNIEKINFLDLRKLLENVLKYI